MTQSARPGEGRTGLICIFLPWLYLTWGGLKPFVGWPSNLGRSLLMLMRQLPLRDATRSIVMHFAACVMP